MSATHSSDPAGSGRSFAPEWRTATIAPTGQLDAAAAAGLEREVRALVFSGCTHVVLDLRELMFVDSSGVRLLRRLDAAAGAGGFTLTIHGLHGQR